MASDRPKRGTSKVGWLNLEIGGHECRTAASRTARAAEDVPGEARRAVTEGWPSETGGIAPQRPPLPRRHWSRISPQAFLGLSC